MIPAKAAVIGAVALAASRSPAVLSLADYVDSGAQLGRSTDSLLLLPCDPQFMKSDQGLRAGG